MENKHRILVVGDVMLDRYISGTVDRISPEAPVPVVKVQEEWTTLGGAANVAANVAAMGCEPVLVGLIGKDDAGTEILAKCQKQNIQARLIRSDKPTVVKTRVMSGQQMLRIDHEQMFSWDDEMLEEFQRVILETIGSVELVLVSDYAKGTLSDAVLHLLYQQATENGKRMVVDPKRADLSAYGPAYLITPNLKELGQSTGHPVNNDDGEIIAAASQLLRQIPALQMLITRSAAGMTLIGSNQILNVPSKAQEVFDVSGAGDTVLATLGVMLTNGNGLASSVIVANAAAGMAVRHLGTFTVSRTELEHACINRKLIERADIEQLKKDLEGKKIVFTNGCFDVLHVGHRRLLEQAKALGDVLIVGLNSDDSVRSLKGESRPVNAEKERMDVLSALASVDHIIAFHEDTPAELLRILRPDVLVKGGDYRKEDIVGKEFAGAVVVLPLLEGHSSSDLMKLLL